LLTVWKIRSRARHWRLAGACGWALNDLKVQALKSLTALTGGLSR
jgi:hypothetical protein